MLTLRKENFKFVRVTFPFVTYILMFDHCYSEGPRVASKACYAISCCGVSSEFTERGFIPYLLMFCKFSIRK